MLRTRINNRGQNLSITVLVLAALAIAVFVVLSFIFFRGAQDTTTTLNSCEQAGGQCTASACGSIREAPIPGKTCPTNQNCCTKLFTNTTNR